LSDLCENLYTKTKYIVQFPDSKGRATFAWSLLQVH